MPPSTRYRVLLVDPVKLRRDRAAEASRLRLEVLGAGTLSEALEACTGTLHAVVVALKQVEDNGLVLAKKLRETIGTTPYLVVHGSPSPGRPAEERAVVAQRHNVDMWLPHPIEPAGLETAIWAELDRRFRPRTSLHASDNEESWSELFANPPTLENMKKLLTKELGGPKFRRY